MIMTKFENPAATAEIRGREAYGSIRGKVDFYGTYGGTILVAEIYGIPRELEEKNGGFYGFYIQAGDLLSLPGNHGVVWMAVYTSRFYPEEVIGKTIVMHGMPEDSRFPPAKSPEERIALGEIVRWEDAGL